MAADDDTPPPDQSDPIRRLVVRYIDRDGRRVTICPPAYAEGAEGRGSVRPKGWLDLGDV